MFGCTPIISDRSKTVIRCIAVFLFAPALDTEGATLYHIVKRFRKTFS